MYRFMLLGLLLYVTVIYVAAQPRPGTPPRMPVCARFTYSSNFDCCNKKYPRVDRSENIGECYQISMNVTSCEKEICIAEKKGYALPNGTIDKEALITIYDDAFEHDPRLGSTIKEKCIYGDVTKYGPVASCTLMKTRICIDIQLLADCPEWSDASECNGIKKAAAECLKFYKVQGVI